jgi:FtsP/CotA-like multicopper oxidase with cupredoxin domain
VQAKFSPAQRHAKELVMTTLRLNRRSFIHSSMMVTASAVALGARWSRASAASPVLTVDTRTIEVSKKAAKVFSIVGPGGRPGLAAREGERFSGGLLNASGEPLQMHWHGQVKAPANQDRARPDGGALAAGQTDAHEFELTTGTHWMHSHTISEQLMLAAPMVTREKDAGDVQDVVIMLHDFAFRSPQEILAEFGGTNVHGGQTMPRGHGMGSMPGMGGHMMGMTHANDVRYDAYLANDRTLDDPEIVQVEKGGRVRLRIINGGTATAFFLSTPGLTSTCIAVDGSLCEAIAAQSYPLAQGQRIDLLVDIPQAGGVFPVLAQVEAAQFLTGIVLATVGASVPKLAPSAGKAQAMLDLAFESKLRARAPLADKRPDKRLMVMLGEEPGYRWTINGAVHGEDRPFEVMQGQRIEMTFMNPTAMMHPMHLHGHHFQVVGIGSRRWQGPVRDTVIVPGHLPVTVAFDANQKGSWFLHCHHLYHMATGMMTELRVS